LAVLVLLIAAVVVIALLSRGDGIGTKENPVPVLAFTTKIAVVNQGKAADRETRKAESDAIVKMFSDYYQEAFVDPRKWGDGKFEDLREKFDKSVQASFTKDLGSLTIGEARTELKRVDPTATSLGVTVYYDSKSRPTFAVAAAVFNAQGTLKQSGPRLSIKQKATFYLQRTGDGWRITAYDANQSQETPTPTPTASPS
jgi:hypothetical protein